MQNPPCLLCLVLLNSWKKESRKSVINLGFKVLSIFSVAWRSRSDFGQWDKDDKDDKDDEIDEIDEDEDDEDDEIDKDEDEDDEDEGEGVDDEDESYLVMKVL